MPRFLFDASSLVKCLKLGCIDLLFEEAIQWLTLYEVLNAFWKEAALLSRIRPSDAVRLASIVAELANYTVILDPRGYEREMIEIALELGLTVYDASYVVLAQKHGLTLVTEDKGLALKARRRINVTSVDNLTA
ncbi:type II toxin-antitoxin system VapC family toxin [Pyrolobus fumarii]|uniref:type II toxin-antitoxin system VapC family toxin n=1 Tax=Pyrolobus fumarii TaxID=54252 RepID=UPI00064F02E7|nr:type II toxin-antitoxin system VapC family toxin [Pyrolobus fumarii]